MRDTPASLLLESALAYAARGWPVFPCHTPTPDGCSCRRDCGRSGKHPRTQHGLKDATTDPAMLHRWWHQWPEANVAIATGARAGLVVLDEDTYKGGDRSRVELEQAYQLLPETVQQLTGGGGVQYLFAHPGTPVKNGVETLGVGLDIRGDGGYIIAPPSLHMSGRHYLWEVAHDPDETPLAPCPPWLLALTREPARRPLPDAGAQIPDHRRNETLFLLGCGFRRRGCTEAVILAALREMNATQCAPPLEDDEVCVIAHSCAQYPPGATGAPPLASQAQTSRKTPHPAYLPYGDVYNARQLIARHGDDLRYCGPWSSWLTWAGTHWQRDQTGETMRRARQTILALLEEARAALNAATAARVTLAQTPEPEPAEIDHLKVQQKAANSFFAHAAQSLNHGPLIAMIKQAQSEPGVPLMPETCDTDLWTLNCTNGTLDLRTGHVRPHDREALLTKCLRLAYDPQALCPTWERFLWHIMGGSVGEDDPDMGIGELAERQVMDARARTLMGFLQRAIGYSLTGDTSEQCLFILHGPTKTGKTTFLETIGLLLGPYAQQAEMSTFLHKEKDQVRNDLADLAASRFVSAVEVQEGKRLAESLVKQLTGADRVKARFLFQEYFTYKPQFKVFLGTNHKPVIHDTDDAIWERIRLVPFTVHIPRAERDKGLAAKLEAELPGILAWAVRGCLLWQKHGLHEPEAVEEATRGYRSEMDHMGQFLDDVCLLGQSYQVKPQVLYDAYQRWCSENVQEPVTGTTFGKRLNERGFMTEKTRETRWRLGIGLKETT